MECSRCFARLEGRPSRCKTLSRKIGYALDSIVSHHHVAEVPLAVLSIKAQRCGFYGVSMIGNAEQAVGNDYTGHRGHGTGGK
jgi:hypothetical protein